MAQLIPLLPPAWRDRRLLALVGALLGLALLDLAAPDLVRLSYYWLPMVMAVAFATPRQVGGAGGVGPGAGAPLGMAPGHAGQP